MYSDRSSILCLCLCLHSSIISALSCAGVATAFAARDILGNVLSGLSMQFSKPFSLGDTIKVCSMVLCIELILFESNVVIIGLQ